MKLKRAETETLCIRYDDNKWLPNRQAKHEALILSGLGDDFGYRPDDPAQDELWIDLDEARDLHRLLGLMLEGHTPPKPQKRRRNDGEEPTR